MAALQKDVAKLAAQLAKLGKRISQHAQAPEKILWDAQSRGAKRQAWADMDSDTDDGGDAPSGSESDASGRRRKRVSFSEDEQQPAASANGESLWITSGRLIEQAKGCASPPTDQEVRAQLQNLLGPKRRQPRKQPARAAEDAAPAGRKASTVRAIAARKLPAKQPATSSAGTAESTWAEILRYCGYRGLRP